MYPIELCLLYPVAAKILEASELSCMANELELNVRYSYADDQMYHRNADHSSPRSRGHPNLIQLLGLCDDKDTVFVAFEENTHSLKQVLLDSRALIHYPVYAKKNQRFSTMSELDTIRYLICVANGMQHLANNNVSFAGILCISWSCGFSWGLSNIVSCLKTRNIVKDICFSSKYRMFPILLLCVTSSSISPFQILHRKLCARNVFLCGSEAKVGGVGLADYSKAGKEIDPLRWTAQEAIKSTMYASKCDVWSFGILMWEVFTIGNYHALVLPHFKYVIHK